MNKTHGGTARSDALEQLHKCASGGAKEADALIAAGGCWNNRRLADATSD
jgi:cellobiose-specific phosphotransferase system component IIA